MSAIARIAISLPMELGAPGLGGKSSGGTRTPSPPDGISPGTGCLHGTGSVAQTAIASEAATSAAHVHLGVGIPECNARGPVTSPRPLLLSSRATLRR